MREVFARLVAAALKRAFAGEHARFLAGTKAVEAAQDRVLARIVGDLSQTVYGQAFGVSVTDDYGRFAARVPLADYETLRPFLAQTNGSVRGRIVHIEPTSGSGGAEKAIPYTRAMQGVFARMFRVWAADLLLSGLELRTGRIFLSQSPTVSTRRETRYLNRWLEVLVSPFLLRLKGDRPFLDDLSLTLLKAADLEVISVWSPSYLTVMFEHIEAHRERFAAALSPERAALLRAGDWAALWPELKLVSAWDQGQAAPFAVEVRARLPQAWFQGKGLLATEAPLTLPIAATGGCLPLYDDVFYEFIDALGAVRRLHALEIGAVYEMVITTPSGLIRYRLGDRVRVTGFYNQAPLLAFEGRTGHSDLTGEKLDEAFVREVLSPLMPDGRFVLLPLNDPPRYVLLSAQSISAEAVEAALRISHHYDLSRSQGQLGPCTVVVLPDLVVRLKTIGGPAFGHAKDTALITDPVRAAGIMSAFTGE